MTAESRIETIGSGLEAGKMGEIPVRSADTYREMLARAGVLQVDIDRSADRLPQATTVTVVVEPTVKLSKTVVACACRARELGIDPNSFLMDATVATLGEGRRKVGMFGRAGEIIRNLRTKIADKERDAYIAHHNR